MIITTTPEPVPDTTPVAPVRSASVKVSLTPEEKATTATRAKDAGLSVSAFCRQRIIA